MYSISLNSKTYSSLKWYKKLTGRFLNIAPLYTIIVVLLTILSQVFMILYFMLPLKIVMLLGSDKVPGFFPLSWQSMKLNTLIFYLAIASVLFFILYLLSKRFIDIYSMKGANKILENNQKVVLFEKQDIFAQNSYSKLASSLSSIIFFILSLLLLAIFYPLLCIAIIIFVLATYLLFSLLLAREKSAKHIIENLNDVFDTVKGIQFFTIFVVILLSYITNFYFPHIIIVILGLLINRRMFNKLITSINDIVNLYKGRMKINYLFFFRDINVKISHDKQDPFWSLLNHESREKWIKDLLNNVLENDIRYIRSHWYRVDIKNIAFLKVVIKNNDNTQSYLLKLFNSNISSQAIHETTILQENINGLYNLPFIGSNTVKEFHCNIFDFVNVEAVPNFKLDHILLKINMMSISPTKDLLERYSRSHPFLYKRLDKKMLNKLYLTAKEDEIEIIKDFEKSFEVIIKIIEDVPLQIINPFMTKLSLLKNEEHFVLLHWSGWKIDSVGTDFPIAEKSINTLKEKLDLNNVKINDIILVSLMSQFEKFCNAENFTGVIDLVPRVLECLKDEK